MRTRARILDDAFALAEANYISYEIPLNLTQYLSMEKEFLPWRMTLNGLGIILRNFNDEPETKHIRVSYFSTIITIFIKCYCCSNFPGIFCFPRFSMIKRLIWSTTGRPYSP